MTFPAFDPVPDYVRYDTLSPATIIKIVEGYEEREETLPADLMEQAVALGIILDV